MLDLPEMDAGLVAVLVYEGLSLFEYGCAAEVFGLPRPEFGKAWYGYATVSSSIGVLRGTGGIQIVADGSLELLDVARTVVVPGWSSVSAPVSDDVCEALRRANARGARIMSICTGAFALAAAGLLDGRRPRPTGGRGGVPQPFPAVAVEQDVLYRRRRRRPDLRGSGGGRRCLPARRPPRLGCRVANHVARILVMPPRREGGQVQFIEEPVSRHSGSALAPLIERVRSALHEDWSIPRLARTAAMSTRTFQRRFASTTGMPVGAWLLKERLAYARRLLEDSDISIDEIAMKVGFGASATLRGHFRSRLAVSPGQYRDAFRAPGRHGDPVTGEATRQP